MTARITIVGLGPGSPRHLTVEAAEVLLSANCIIARTERHPVVAWLRERGKTVETFDALYEEAEEFEDLNILLRDRLLALGEKGPVVYAVPGNPVVGEQAVHLLLEQYRGDPERVRLVYGAGCADLVLQTAAVSATSGVAVIEAGTLTASMINPDAGHLITAIDTRMTASEAKITLLEAFPEDHPVVRVRSAGIEGLEHTETIPLYQLDRDDAFDHFTTVYLPPVPLEKRRYRFQDLLDIMARLRGPEGCPWDQKQTHQSLLPFLIEEAYEVFDAVEQDDLELMEEELGDLLLQIVFHAQIASENGYFSMDEVLGGICGKMINRHPHVFADGKADTAEEVLVNWEAIKKEEKQESSQHESMVRIPRQMPALMRSYKIQEKAADVGFDWDTVHGALEKVQEEFGELMELLEHRDADRMEDEMGDLLFAVVNVARFLKIRPEQALRRTSDKFLNRFEYVENKVKEKGKNMKECNLEELDGYWNEAKTLEK